MPTIDLVRDERIQPGGPGVQVRVEDHPALGAGFVAELLPDPASPASRWRREFIQRRWTDRTGGRPVGIYGPLLPGTYEAKSVRRAGQSLVCYFAVEGDDVEVIGHAGDEDAVLAKLTGLGSDELAALQVAEEASQPLPRLEGTARQCRWAEQLRERLLAQAGGDERLVEGLLAVRDAAWFIANREKTVEALRSRLRAKEWFARRDALGPEPGPF
jgi:hypothetical protein